MSALKKLHRDRKGAVLVEFLIAFMPLMMTFSSFVQVAQIATASLVARHSTVVAARAAAVISNKYKNTPDAAVGKNKGEVTAAYEAALGPWAPTMTAVDVEINDDALKEDVFGMVEVTSTALYSCSVPFGNFLVCGGSRKHQITKSVKFPHQGGCYKDLGGGGCGGE